MKTLKIAFLIILLTPLFFSCQKELSLEGAVTSAGTWQFNDSTKLYTGNMDSAYIETTGTTKTMNLKGKTADGSQTFLLHLYATDSFTVGTYKASLFKSDFQYFTQAKSLYDASQFIGEFIVTITAIGNNSVTGIFSGLAEDSTSKLKQLTLGQFTSRINLSTNGTGGGGGGGGAAVGTLGVSAGSCTPVTNAGTYTQGVALTSTNTVTVTVTVTTPGTYTISTNTVNGVSFSKTGTFTATGSQTVILNGSGTPVSSGNQNFTVTFGGSTCNFTLNFGSGVAPATGTLSGSPNLCAPVTPAGTYKQGVALTAANTVSVQVNVATVGAYTISTATVNGVIFSSTGNFTTTGLKTVILTGTGTPTNSGSQNFSVTFGTSVCNFSIIFAPGTVVTDYFPTTVNSFWNYGLQGGMPSDTLRINVIPFILSAGGNNYSTFKTNNTPPDSLYYRKPGGDYMEYFNTQAFFGFDSPGTPPNVEYIFLKDNVPQGTTWQSPNITGLAGGVSFTIYIKMTLFEKATTPTTSGSVTSSDVLKVRYEYFVTSAPATPFFTEERWFAKSIGLIYNSFNDGTNTDIYRIGGYQVL
jgi:hypothetical protein